MTTRKQPATFFLIGQRGSGKTTVGRLLAERLALPFLDTDAMVEAEAGRSIAGIVEEQGWEAFRSLESGMLQRAVAVGAAVIATGGGMVLARKNRDIMRAAGHVLYLEVPPEELCTRLERARKLSQRPPLAKESLHEEVYRIAAERGPIYRACAQHVVAGTLSAGEAAAAIVRLLFLENEECL